MQIDKGIFIKNIYYMLSYAFQILKQTNFDKIKSEEFADIGDLFACILYRCVSQQLKQGLHREYIDIDENIPTLRGKINIVDTIKNKINHKQLISCNHDEYSENNLFNQIIKTTINFLIASHNVKKDYKKDLKKVLMYFKSVDDIDYRTIKWKVLKFNRNNQSYNMIMNICYFILHDLMMTTESGNKKVLQFTEERMPKLFEKFVLEYYKQHYKNKLNVSAAKIAWNIAEDDDTKFLPDLCTDITISDNSGKVLIIDTKYYASTLAIGQYDKPQIHRNNLNQIFVYVKNKDVDNTGDVAGLLLYAKTNEDIVPDETYHMGGNEISVKTLDLNKNFEEISSQLDNIADIYFNI